MTKSIMTIGHNDTTLAHQWDPCTQDLHLPEGDDNQTILNTATLITLAITLATKRLSIPRHPRHDSDHLSRAASKHKHQNQGCPSLLIVQFFNIVQNVFDPPPPPPPLRFEYLVDFF